MAETLPAFPAIAVKLLEGYGHMLRAATMLRAIGRSDLALVVEHHAGECLVFEVNRADLDRWLEAKRKPQ